MNINKDLSLQSSDHKLSLSLHIEGPQDANAIVIFSHGMTEHKERYYDFIRILNKHGYLSVIHDQRGHGCSVKHQDDYGYFYDERGNGIIEDLNVVVTYMKNTYPDLDLYIFAHSMGTLVARNYLQNYDDQIKKMVLCGPPYYNKAVHAGYYLTKVMAMFRGSKYRSKLINHIAIGYYDKKFIGSTVNKWLCSDPKQVELYNNNPKCNFIFTLNGFQCLFHLVKQCFVKSAYKMKNKKLQLLFIAGADDPVIGNDKKFLKGIKFMNSLGYQHSRHILYPNLRHELLNEKNHENIYQDILNFYNGSK